MLIPKDIAIHWPELCDPTATRYVLGDVEVVRVGEKRLAMAATDGRVLGIVEWDELPVDEFPRPASLLPLEPIELPFRVNGQSLQRAGKSCPKRMLKPILSNVMVGRRGDDTILRTTDLVQPSEIAVWDREGNYPLIANMISTYKPADDMTSWGAMVNASLLAKVLRIVDLVLPDADTVQVLPMADGKSIIIRSRSYDRDVLVIISGHKPADGFGVGEARSIGDYWPAYPDVKRKDKK